MKIKFYLKQIKIRFTEGQNKHFIGFITKTKKLDKVFKEKIQEPLLSPMEIKLLLYLKKSFVKNLNSQKICK